MGVFAMFYGLYGPYWFPALANRRGPVLIDALRELGYQFSVHTSARFTYPEFDRTVFASLDAGDLHEWREGESWQRDRAMVDAVLSFLDQREPERPFFVFSFFESAHARYAFPEECAVRRPYLADLDYGALDLERDIEAIRNRYLNSCRHLDSQLGRLCDALAARGLLERTVVVVTGDHGEEFLEHGRWGHGSSFVDEQVRVPLVLWIPGVEPGVVDRMSSHLDLPATLLPLLGARNRPGDLSLGRDLLGTGTRDFTVIADWSRLCVVTESRKASFATQTEGLFRTETTDAHDRPVADGATLPVDLLAEVLEGLGRFRARSGARHAVEVSIR
jgi:membrane-anchored protein YejM (alkaline phosphatase superfamily)